jgi:NAD(P)H dehydrogenase (quinone)
MDQPKVAVIFHGASGALQGLAKEVAAGAEEEGAVVRVRRVADHEVPGDGETEGLATPDDVRWADAVIFGSPSRYGNVASQLKSYVETLEVLGGDSLRKIIWSGFASGDGVLHRGREATLSALFQTLSHLGGVLVSAPRVKDLPAGDEVYMLARQTGRDVAEVARRLLVGAAAESGRELGQAAG